MVCAIATGLIIGSSFVAALLIGIAGYILFRYVVLVGWGGGGVGDGCGLPF